MSEYRKAFVAAVAAIGVVVSGFFPEVDGLQEAFASVGAVLVWMLPNAPHEGAE